MAEIRVHAFQPFASRVGTDTVLSLTFRYDPGLISDLKTALREAGRYAGVKQPGGWLPEYRVWFVERCVWPDVRPRLVKHGHTLHEGQAAAPAAPAPAAPAPKPARAPATDRRTAAVLEEWAWTMKTRWSDDAAPVIEAGLELLREMLLGVPTEEA